MTTTTAWDRFRDDVRTATVASAVEQFERLTWNSERIHQTQRDGLRALLHTCRRAFAVPPPPPCRHRPDRH